MLYLFFLWANLAGNKLIDCLIDNCFDEFKCFPRVSVLCALPGLAVACWCTVALVAVLFIVFFFRLALKLLFFLCVQF